MAEARNQFAVDGDAQISCGHDGIEVEQSPVQRPIKLCQE
jgi:hypothetical protein